MPDRPPSPPAPTLPAHPQLPEACQQLRQQMSVTERYAYLDHAAVAPLPAASSEAISRYSQEAQTHGDAIWPQWAKRAERVRVRAAELLSAQTEEIALVNSTTQGINLVALGFPWRPGDNVVVPSNEFPTNLLPWRNLRAQGVEVRAVDMPDSGEIELDRLRDVMDGNTRLLAISWVGFLSGFRVDVGQVVEMAHDQGCLVVLDAIQGLGAFPLDVGETGVDFVCADGHKWMLGPEGAGLFYTKLQHLDLLRPVGIGWNSLADGGFDPRSTRLKDTAARYEGGTTNMPGMHGFAESLRLLLELGVQRPDSCAATSILEHAAWLRQLLGERGLKVHAPARRHQQSGITGITWPGAGPADYAAARKYLLEQNVVVSLRGGRLRVSIHAYNNAQDLLRLVSALDEFRAQAA